jgi:chaperone required for assembly of F1-ATPase
MPVDSYRLCIESGSSRGGGWPWSRTLVIALALIEGRLDTGEAFARSQLDESFQIDAWGEDTEQAERRAALAAEIAAAARFKSLSRA